ncbi:MAG: sigma-70 family RNA polymerase sigma factor [Ruminococcus flavefaciens]|nr:sigma-70 family RNA polymerase sigma factor [Ruminococcus flavefaciens]
MLGIYLAMLDTPEEKSKFEVIYKEYKNAMYNQAYGILQDSYLAEDAVQNAFLKLIKNLEKINKIMCKETRNYLVILVRGTAIDIYNQNKKIVPIDEIDDTDTLDLPEMIENRLERERVFEIISTMEEKYSDILMLKLFYDYSNDEIARFLNINPEHVSIRFFRAKAKLKKLIMEEYGDD